MLAVRFYLLVTAATLVALAVLAVADAHLATSHAWGHAIIVAAFAVLMLWGFGAWIVKRGPGRWYWTLLAVVQVTIGIQVVAGLILLAIYGISARPVLHYLYGSLSLGAALVPWFYAPTEGPRRLLWFSGMLLLAAALAVRAFMTAT